MLCGFCEWLCCKQLTRQTLQQRYQHDAYEARYTALLGEVQAVAAREAAVALLTPALDTLDGVQGAVCDELCAAVARVEQLRASVEADRRALEGERAALNARVAMLEGDADSMRGLCESAQQEVDVYRAQLEVGQEELTAMRQQYDDASKMAAEMRQLLDAANGVMEEKDLSLADAHNELDNLAARVKELEEALATSDEQLTSARDELAAMVDQQAARDVEDANTSKIAASKGSGPAIDVEELVQAVKERDACIERLTQQIEEQAQQHTELRDFIAEERQV